MRNVLTSLAIVVVMLALASCSIDTPVEQSQNPAHQTVVAPKAGGITPVQLPASASLSKIVPVSALITAENGGELSFEHRDGDLYIKISLKFKPHAVNQDMVLTMRTDNQILAATFGPEGTQFNVPGELTVEARGLSFIGYPNPQTLEERLRFLYLNEETGDWQIMDASGFNVDVNTGTITCTGGVVPHFSRYGFGFIG